MANIIEIQVGEDKVYLKKDYFGYRVVEPPKKWYHYIVGSKRNMFILLIIAVIALALYVGVQELVSQYQVIADNPCGYCKPDIINNMRLNLTIP